MGISGRQKYTNAPEYREKREGCNRKDLVMLYAVERKKIAITNTFTSRGMALVAKQLSSRCKKNSVVHNQITNFIDFFYGPFKKWLPLQTFRYAACGGTNTLLGLALYTVSYKFIFKEQVFHFAAFALTPHIAALFFAFLFNFPVGMFLMKYVVFVDSSLRGRVQLFRYFLVFVSNLFLNYVLLKLMRDYWKWNAIAAQVVATAVVITTSYILQRHYSFKVDSTTETRD